MPHTSLVGWTGVRGAWRTPRTLTSQSWHACPRNRGPEPPLPQADPAGQCTLLLGRDGVRLLKIPQFTDCLPQMGHVARPVSLFPAAEPVRGLGAILEPLPGVAKAL